MLSPSGTSHIRCGDRDPGVAQVVAAEQLELEPERVGDVRGVVVADGDVPVHGDDVAGCGRGHVLPGVAVVGRAPDVVPVGADGLVEEGAVGRDVHDGFAAAFGLGSVGRGREYVFAVGVRADDDRERRREAVGVRAGGLEVGLRRIGVGADAAGGQDREREEGQIPTAWIARIRGALGRW
jgi:hypothetical protein